MSQYQENKRRLASLKQEIKITENQLFRTEKDLERVQSKVRLEKLIRVGLIVEQAGLLDTYSEYDLYLLLIQNRDYLQKTSSKMVPPIQFHTT
ncbi:hypothetical protein [Mitsuokella multacida]|uniref:hypothetical protein n=1 Tax=Mitsuokella multacida TaxID=52226 RepID=UPI0026DC5D2D|nr:hypothetical protein [Mitsuokella multacida]